MGRLLSGESLTLQVVIKASGNPLTQQVTVSAEPVDALPTNNQVSVLTQVRQSSIHGNSNAADID
jgi:hypothetical protein